MKECSHFSKIQQEVGSPLYKCNINNAENLSSFGKIKESLKDKMVIPNGDCPFKYNNLDLSDCPCFEK